MMPTTLKGLSVRFDMARGLLLCSVTGPLSDVQSSELERALTSVTAAARRHGPLRVLWDNRVGVPLGPILSEMFRTLLVEQGQPEDRVAIIVENSIAKARSRPQMAEGHQLFASENAALTWLSVGAAPSAAA
ncbi:MAG: hypothetical protein ABW169_14700 [Sphingobium sp.]